MRVPILLICSAFLLNRAQAAPLAAADRETLLNNLEKLVQTADANVDARFRVALADYRIAVSSDSAAIELYFRCIEKIKFPDSRKKPNEFVDWKQAGIKKFSDPNFRLALRYQLRWLILTLQASSLKADHHKLPNDAQDLVDGIFDDFEKLRYQQETLKAAVTSSVFAQAYEVHPEKLDGWPLSPLELGQIYDKVILPPFRNPNRLDGLRATWMKRIREEGMKVEFCDDPSKDDKKPISKLGSAASKQSPELEKFILQNLPQLQWEMEMDLFRSGDESGAAVRMFVHLEKNLAHSSVREWTKQLQNLLKPQVVVPTTPPAKES